MRLSGAALGRDAVLVWTGERELTRFAKDGSRASFTVPLVPHAWHLGAHGVRVVDHQGTVHRYTLAGEHAGAVALREPVRGEIKAAALSAASDRIALVSEPAGADGEWRQLDVFDDGQPLAWAYEQADGGRRETGVELSADGRWLMVGYETFPYFTGQASAGHHGAGVQVLDATGTKRFEHYSWILHRTRYALAPDAESLVHAELADDSEIIYLERRDGTETCIGGGRAARVAFGADHVGVLTREPSRLELVELATGRYGTLELPEQFDDLVLVGEHVVVVERELGAWWIPLASVTFDEAD